MLLLKMRNHSEHVTFFVFCLEIFCCWCTLAVSSIFVVKPRFFVVAFVSVVFRLCIFSKVVRFLSCVVREAIFRLLDDITTRNHRNL